MTATVAKQGAGPTPAPTRAVAVLALFEASRMLVHPITWVGVALSIWLMWTLGRNVAPILERDSVFLAGLVLPLAAATLLVANLSVLRQRKTPEMLDASPGDVRRRILGVQVGVLGPVLLATVVQAIGLIYLLIGGPIGSVVWLEFMGGPVAVALFGVGGTFLGRLLPHPIVPLVALVAVATLLLLARPDFGSNPTSAPAANIEWLAPWMPPSAVAPIEELASRPSVLHLSYLIVLTVLLGAFAIPSGPKSGMLRLVGVALLATGVVAASLSLKTGLPESISYGWPDAAANQVCDVADGVEFCAFELSAGWISRWQETVAAVDSLAPVHASKVLQRPSNVGFEETGALNREGLILVSTHWDREGAVPYFRLDLALRAAYSAVGLPTTMSLRHRSEEEIQAILAGNPGLSDEHVAHLRSELSPVACSAIGHARGVVALWMATVALERGGEGLANVIAERPGGETVVFSQGHLTNVYLGEPDARLVLELLNVPEARVHRELQTRWEAVIDPATTSADLAAWFDLASPTYEPLEFFTEPC